MREYQRERDVLDGAAWAEALAAEKAQMETDWDFPDDVRLYHNNRRRAERGAVLNRLVPKRRCPQCDEMFLYPRQWVVNARKTRAVCRGCWEGWKATGRWAGGRDVVVVRGCVIDRVEEGRAVLNARVLRDARMETGLTQRRFAGAMGWSESYQCQLERGKVEKICPRVGARIIGVLAAWGAKTLDFMG